MKKMIDLVKEDFNEKEINYEIMNEKDDIADYLYFEIDLSDEQVERSLVTQLCFYEDQSKVSIYTQIGEYDPENMELISNLSDMCDELNSNFSFFKSYVTYDEEDNYYCVSIEYEFLANSENILEYLDVLFDSLFESSEEISKIYDI